LFETLRAGAFEAFTSGSSLASANGGIGGMEGKMVRPSIRGGFGVDFETGMGVLSAA